MTARTQCRETYVPNFLKLPHIAERLNAIVGAVVVGSQDEQDILEFYLPLVCVLIWKCEPHPATIDPMESVKSKSFSKLFKMIELSAYDLARDSLL